jgi:hypothetical protein
VRKVTFHREAFPQIFSIWLSGTRRFITFREECALKGSTQSKVVHLFDVKVKFGQFIGVMRCKNTVAELCAGPIEIAESRLGFGAS